jgi:hypothetical protein
MKSTLGLIIFMIYLNVVSNIYLYLHPIQKVYSDSIYITLPTTYDTINVNYVGNTFFRAVFDKYSQFNYNAPEGLILDVQRSANYTVSRSDLNEDFWASIQSITMISDSLLLKKRDFLRHHQFFVVVATSDSVSFHKARGEYLYKQQ